MPRHQQNERDDNLIRFRLLIAVIALTLLTVTAYAEPPHPSKNYKWEVLNTGNVVLYYLENGQYMRYVYRLIHEAEPATPCAPKFGKKTFRLVTWDTSYPYYYTLDMVPVMRWNPLTQEYVQIK